ncbi:hypothetical protein BBF96_15100 [Anoxybacter fermentans]|uniref:Selenium-dependent hydroxylase accessory protein YqeC n=1 Tax=Anoxybacter fermentans TaxID=1323375 RepID=A0A3Q9HSI2_9FIRM|nr:selenium cofactor biosynthesis protein YqeC [Anoxybacter fermentans]AZR74583.1 hypothetical protein BBF96_15100 [Anoxybacter fermentans]
MFKEILDLKRHTVVTLIGAGGKTTTMYYLAYKMAQANCRVLITTTTKIYYLAKDVERFVKAQIYDEWLYKLKERARPGKYLVAGSGVKDGKVLGVVPEWIDELAGSGIFDLILVEGDGSAQKPLKAPAEFEPVIPESTSLLLPVLGLSGVGQSLSKKVVHRVEKFMELTGLKIGEKIGIDHLFQVYTQPEGYDLLKWKDICKVVPIINQVDDDLLEEIGQKLAGLFLKSGIDPVLLTCYRKNQIIWRICR